MSLKATVLVYLVICYGQSEGYEWNYNELGPDVWGEIEPTCNGQRQSPVNIRTSCTVQDSFPEFSFSQLHTERINFTLTNNGHTIRGETSSSSSLTLSGAKLGAVFSFDSFHLHWGPNHRSGSEHQINGEKFAGESHFVYRNPLNNQNTVLGFFMKSQTANKTRAETLAEKSLPSMRQTNEWTRYFDAARKLTRLGDSVNISLNLNLLMGQTLKDFWRYNGSLTTPPCSESVVWNIFKDIILIFNYEFDTFRREIFFDSFREPQPLYYRKVYRSFATEITSDIPDERCCIINSSSASSLYLFRAITFTFLFQFMFF